MSTRMFWYRRILRACVIMVPLGVAFSAGCSPEEEPSPLDPDLAAEAPPDDQANEPDSEDVSESESALLANGRCPLDCQEGNVACTGFILWSTCWCPKQGLVCPEGGWWASGGCFGAWKDDCHH